MTSRLSIELQSSSGKSFAGHIVAARFLQKIGRPGAYEGVMVSNVTTASLDAAGRANLEFPETLDRDSGVSLQVIAPDGEILHGSLVPISHLDGARPFVVEVDPKEYFPIEHTDDPTFGQPSRIRGLLIDPQGKGRVGGRQIVIFAQDSGSTEPRVVTVAKTDAKGYFSAPYPIGMFSGAAATVDGSAPVPMRLLDDGRFPERVVLAAEVPAGTPAPEKKDCSCESDVPRDPDTGDLVNSPETFTSDVGGGHCIDFTKPNRVLEEFDFYTVVRTTEPAIRGLTISEPPKVTVRELLGLLDPKIFNFLMRSQPEERLFPAREALPAPDRIDRGTPRLRPAPRPGVVTFDPDDPETLASRALVLSQPELEHLSEVIGLASLRVATTRDPATPPPAGVDELDLEDVRIEAAIVRTLADDPDGFSLTRLAQAEITTRKNDLVRLTELIKRREGGRGGLTCTNSVDWDDEPTFYQACTIAHGHILHLKQQWVADGYSLGDLLYSLPLAPCQKKQIAVVDWDRRDSAARVESLEEREQLSAFISRDRDISEIANASVRESMSGGSSARTSSFGGGLGIAAGGLAGPAFIGGLLGIGGGTSGASSRAWQNASRAASANSLQQLRDMTTQGASAVRSQRSTVIQTVRQGETVRVETDVVANHNHCHTLTIEYFEVLRHFLVRMNLADVQECLLVPLLMSRFDSAKARRWREPISAYLREPRLLRGFDALQRIADNYVGSDMPVGSYAEEELEYVDGFLRIQFRIQRPRDKEDGSFLDASWQVLSWLGISPQEWWQSYLRDQQQRDRIFAQVLGPQIAQEITNGLQIFAVDEDDNETPLPIDLTLVSDFRNDQPLYVSLRLRDDLPPLRRDRVKFIKIGSMVQTNAGLKNIDEILPTGSRILVHSGQMGYRTAHIAHDLFRHSGILNDLSGTDGVLIYTPLSREELRRPRDEDKEIAKALLKHLNDHLELYHRAIWWQMDAQRRYMLLDGFIAPNSGGRSVASVVENRLIGIIGNCVVLPVARGYHLDPTFEQDTDDPIDLLEHYQPTTKPAPLRIAVPTKGVFAEAAMGACNSCEKIDESRFWRWEESPCPGEPTAIQPPSTESRRAEPPVLTPQPLPQPIVAFQNVPAAPEPQGFGALAQLIANPNLFRDITGLTENQKNALAGLQAALNTAQFFGGKAADLAIQASMRRDIDKTLEKINQQHASGAITDAQRSQLTEAALRSMMGGGTESPTSNTLTEQPELREAIRNIGSTPGGSINVTRATTDATETVGLSTPADALRSFIIEGVDLTPERRAFHPRNQDKSGVISLTVRVPRLPDGGSIRWSVPPSQAGRFTLAGARNTQNGNRADITALRSGLSEVDVEVRNRDGVVIESTKYPLSIPQFVTVDVDAATFTPLLTGFGLVSFEIEEVLRNAKAVTDMVLNRVNVRTVWLMAPFNETLPAQFRAGGAGAGNVTRALFEGDPPVVSQAGLTSGGTGGGIGPQVFDERISVWPGAFDDDVVGNTAEEVDDVTREVVQVLILHSQTSSVEKDLAIQVLGRLLGETMAHEICHSLIGSVLTGGFHNNPAIPSDLMNLGGDRSFQDRSGFEITGPIGGDLTTVLRDQGIFTIDIPTTDSQALLDTSFPVPPTFR